MQYSRNLTTDNWHLISSALENETLADFIESHQLAVGQNPKIGLAPYDNSKEEMNSRWNYLEYVASALKVDCAISVAPDAIETEFISTAVEAVG